MAEKNKIYRCLICGAIIERINSINSSLVCCDKPMTLLNEKIEDSKIEKHVPFVKKITSNKVLVKIGEEQTHPMLKEHYIQFIEVICKDNSIFRKYLTYDDKPEFEFEISFENILFVREYCNLHGLWRS